MGLKATKDMKLGSFLMELTCRNWGSWMNGVYPANTVNQTLFQYTQVNLQD